MLTKSLCKLLTGFFLLGLGITFLAYPPLNTILDIRLRMLPAFLPYRIWSNPPQTVLLHVYFFNVTNAESFMNGTDDKIQVEEVGPIYFREKLSHTNIKFNENSTLTYTLTREPVYLPEMNSINMNDTIVAFNFALLSMVSFLSEAPFFLKVGLNLLIKKYNSQPFKKTTVYNYLLNSTDPLLEAARMLAGGRMVPSTNVGCLSQMFLKLQHNLTVRIGPKYENHEYFTIDKFDGYDHIPGFKKCDTKFTNSSDASVFPQFLEDTQSLKIWRSNLCKAIDLKYINQTINYGLIINRYHIPLDIFHRTEPSYLDCWRSSPALPNGISDVSACNNGFHFSASFPHFLNADPAVTERLKGFNASREKHSSYLLIEKVTGIPLSGKASFQINLNVHKLSGFTNGLDKFSGMFIPTSYVTLEAQDQPWYIMAVIYSIAVVIPKCQLFVSIALVATGLLLFYFIYLEFKKPRKVKLFNDSEKETFLKK